MAPPKTLPKRKRKSLSQLTKGQWVMIAGGLGLLLYVILTIVSAVYLSNAEKKRDTEKEALSITDNCTKPSSTFTKDYVLERLHEVIGVTVRVIFWTWQVIIFTLSVMVYIVYTFAGWQENHTMGRAWCFVIVVITVLNFVPCSYIFTFGNVTALEKVAYWGMLGVILAFRILDAVLMFLLIKDIKLKKTRSAVQPTNAPPSEANLDQSQANIPPEQLESINQVKVDTNPVTPADPNKKTPETHHNQP